ncbi:PAS domain S-box protein [Haloarcula salina]|uniref:histidine kinase n=1 Tax=Haloarcula salina TaxID=1429914 RepID=A0AA41G2B4_9EURY|nr:PAS domain S-box protein [Haloarcula salina]MBV0902976.1 PAS domain S-box protein [Haloarcula salina]
MDGYTDQFLGAVFRTLESEGHERAQRQLVDLYQSQAATDRDELIADITAELVTVLHRNLGPDEEIDVLTGTVESLVDRLASVIEVAPAAVIVVDGDGTVELWNSGAERTFGWDAADVLGESYYRILADSPTSIESALERLEAGEALTSVTTQHRHADGSLLDVRLWAAPLEASRNGYAGATFVVSDITEQRQREQRLAVLNRLLRHNVRNDITVIRGRLELLADAAPNGDDHFEAIDDRLSNIVELSDTARRLEQLQSDGEPDRTQTDLGTLVEERAARLRSGWPEAEIRTTVPGPVSVLAHELLPYALDNLLENAVEHNDAADPRVEVEVAGTRSGESDRVTLTIRDNGPGLPENEKRVLASETETPLSHSTGTGLWLTRWITQVSGGEINIGANRFDGTTVTLRLRSAPEDQAECDRADVEGLVGDRDPRS